MHELFVTDRAAAAHPALAAAAADAGVRISPITDRAADGLSETVTPQGLVAVCSVVDRPLETVLPGARLVVVLVDVAEPGNAGTVIRVADAAGADAAIDAAIACHGAITEFIRQDADEVVTLDDAIAELTGVFGDG